jgi:hypothetical protein
MADVAGARTLAQQASDELTAVFAKDPSLTDTGNAFSDAMSRLNAKIFDATLRSTAAGARGQQALGFVQGQIDTCQRLAGSAVLEYDSLHSPSADSSASACLSDPDQKVSGVSVPDTGGLAAALADLEQLEGQTLAAQHTSFWLHPLRFVWLLLAPTLAMLALLAATGRILARHFRRIISPLLLLAVADTAVVALVLSVLSSSDDAHLSANPWAAHPVTMTIEGVALVGALLLVYLGYRPRLAEYRFRTR